MKTITEIIDEIIRIEDGYVNHPDDAGGPTNFGITLRVLREYYPNASEKDVKNLSKDVARYIYKEKYFEKTNISEIFAISNKVGIEVFDAAINMGPKTAIILLQRALNVFNKKASTYPDLRLDGIAGSDTQDALKQYMRLRGSDGADTLHKALLCLRGAKYIDIAERIPKNESFVYGWIKNRINF